VKDLIEARIQAGRDVRFEAEARRLAPPGYAPPGKSFQASHWPYGFTGIFEYFAEGG
jgi:hypothetical protein